MAHQAGPVRESLGPGHRTARQVLTHPRPRMQLRRETSGKVGDVQQHGLATLLDRQAAQTNRVHTGRTKQLRRGTEVIQFIREFAKTESNANFLIADGGQVRRERWIKLSPIMTGATLNGYLKQPLGDSFARSTGEREPAQQSGDVRHLAQLASECRRAPLFVQFHFQSECSRKLNRNRYNVLIWNLS